MTRVTAAFLILAAAPARAAAQWTPCEAYGYSDVVFSGTAAPRVTRWLDQPGHPRVPSEQTPFTVDRWFRGTGPDLVFTVRGRFTPGERYLVYGTNYANGPVYMADWDMGSKRFDDAHADLQFLAGVTDAQGGTLVGRAIERVYDLTAGRAVERPAGGVPLVITGPDRVINVNANGDGSYAVTVLAPGTYRITTALLEAQLTLSDPATIKNGGCAKRDVRVHPNGRVRGTVLAADGKPTYATVDLVPAGVEPDKTGHIFAAGSVSAGSDGRFEFDGRSPGRYLLGVNLMYAPTPAAPYKSVYYPGSSSRESAQAIEVGYGTIVEGAVVQLGERLPIGRLSVIVQAPDGATKVKACIRNDAQPIMSSSVYDAPPPPKAVTVEAVAGLPYRIQARFVLGDQHFVSDEINVETTSDTVVVTAKPNRLEEKPRWSGFCSRDLDRD